MLEHLWAERAAEWKARTRAAPSVDSSAQWLVDLWDTSSALSTAENWAQMKAA